MMVNLLDIFSIAVANMISFTFKHFSFSFKSLHNYSKKFHLLFTPTDIHMSIFRTLALIPEGEKTKQSEHDRPYKHPWSPFLATTLAVLIEQNWQSQFLIVSHSFS